MRPPGDRKPQTGAFSPWNMAQDAPKILIVPIREPIGEHKLLWGSHRGHIKAQWVARTEKKCVQECYPTKRRWGSTYHLIIQAHDLFESMRIDVTTLSKYLRNSKKYERRMEESYWRFSGISHIARRKNSCLKKDFEGKGRVKNVEIYILSWKIRLTNDGIW